MQLLREESMADLDGAQPPPPLSHPNRQIKWENECFIFAICSYLVVENKKKILGSLRSPSLFIIIIKVLAHLKLRNELLFI